MNVTKKRIGILGGTFNPIHVGHLRMAECAREAQNLDTVLIMPTGNSYMKNASDILSGKTRLEMVKCSIDSNPYFEASDLEIRREGQTYTYETLEQLHSINPNAEFFFIVGADCLFSIERWYKPERIFEQCTLLAANRNAAPTQEILDKCKDLQNRFDAKIVLFDMPQMDISSSMIRNLKKNGKSIRYFVTDSVLDYINTKHLYEGGTCSDEGCRLQ